jgi:hypothetical protein
MANELFSFNESQKRELISYIAEQIAVVSAVNTTQATSITNLNAWATALATKLNADAGVTDVNYDTDPQA